MNTDTVQLCLQCVLMIAGPLLAQHHVSFTSADLQGVAGALATLAGVVWKFAHWNATPAAQSLPVKITPPSGPLCVLLFSLAASFTVFLGCAGIAAGNDPIVVDVERTETVAKDTFDEVLAIDDSQRSFYRTNAPAFHNFCEWLRQPQTVEVTNTLPRAAAMLVSLDDVKLSYKSAGASSNDVYTALETVTSAMSQANAWLTIGVATNSTSKTP